MTYLRRRWRPLSALMALTTLVVLLVLPTVGPAQAEMTPFAPGMAAASANVAKVRIFYAGYALQLPLGTSATTYENRQSRSLGGAYDLSAVLGLAKAKVPELSPISTDSNSGDSTKAVDLGAGPVLGRVDLSAKDVPASTASVRMADVDLPGLVRIEGGRSHATTEVVGGKVRRAEAEVTVGSVSLLGGLVELEGLRWDAAQETGATTKAVGTFSLGTLKVAGAPVATDLHDLDPVLAQVNAALAATGLVVEGPLVTLTPDGSVNVSALRLGIIKSPIGASTLAPVIAGVRPLLVPLLDALTAQDDTLGLAALVGDLGLGVADGSGGIEIGIGGAIARTAASSYSPPLAAGSGPVAPAAPSGPGGFSPSAPLPAAAAPGSSPIGATTPASATGPLRCALAASPQRHGSCRDANLPGAIGIVAVAITGWGTYEAALRRRRLRPAVVGDGAL